MRLNGIVGALMGTVLLLVALAAPAQPQAGSTYTLQSTVITTPQQGSALAERLARAGDGAGADLLRWSLLELQLDTRAGTATPPMRAYEHIGRAARQGAPGAETPLGLRWEAVHARWVQLRWVEPPPDLPDALGRPAPALRALAPGVWAGDDGAGWSALAIVRLDNQGPLALTTPPFVLRLERPGGAFALECMPPIRPLKPGPPGAALADGGVTVQPGAGRPFACRGSASAEWAPVLARAARGQPAPGERLRLVPGHLASHEGVGQLLQAWAQTRSAEGLAPAAPTPPTVPAAGSTWRTAAAVGAAAALLLMLLRTLHARIDGDLSAASAWLRSLPAALGVLLLAGAIGSPWGQWLLGLAGDAAAQAMRALMARFPMDSGPFGAGGGTRRGGGSLAAAFVPCTIGLYLAGRLLLRLGFSRTRVRQFTWLVVPVLGPLSAAAVWSPPAGEGWSRAVPFVLMLVALSFFFAVGIAVELLHGMNELMDREGTTWPAEVLRALRRSLDFRSPATRAEWWGYVVFGAILWATARGYGQPWERALGLALLVPLPALVARRLRGLSNGEAWSLAGLLALVALNLLSG